MMPCRMRPPFTLILAMAFFTLFAGSAGAEPVVTIESPLLRNASESLQAMLDESIAEFSGQINDLVSETVDKPDFLAGSARAAAQAVLVPSTIHAPAKPYIGLGCAGSFYSPWLNTDVVSNLDDLDVTEDIDAGACVEPLVIRGGLPLNFLMQGLSVAANAGYMNAETGSFGVKSLTAGLSAAYEVFPAKSGAIAWDGLSVTVGGDFARQKLSVTVEANTVTEVIPIDPDGVGPLASFDATVMVDPVIRAGVETTVFSAHAGATTGVTFFRALSLFAGFGATAGWTNTEITIDSKDPISVSGYLGDLIETPGTIGISGTAAERRSAFVSPYIAAGLTLTVGAVDLSIPVSIKPFDSIGTGIFIGVKL